MEEPLVSVLMPVYNREPFLHDSIFSIINQTYKNFEFIIIDDGSSDNSLQIIKGFNDDRIKIYIHKENKGLPFTRNESIKAAKGKYIAFLDSDDIAFPERLYQQVNFLEKNPNYGMIGSWLTIIDKNGKIVNEEIKFPASAEEIPIILLFKNYFFTSSVMVKSSCLPDNPFEQEFTVGEDYNLFITIAEKYKVWNLQQVLTYYRVHENNISKTLGEKMEETDMIQMTKQLSKFNTHFTEEEKKFYLIIGKIFNDKEYNSFLNTDFVYADKCLNKLITANISSKRYNNELFVNYLYKLWFQIFVGIKRYDIKLFLKIYTSVFYKRTSTESKIKFFIKCLFNFKTGLNCI